MKTALAISISISTLVVTQGWGHEAGPSFAQMQGYTPSAPAPSGTQPPGWKYPWSCCSGMDCRRVQQSDIEERPEGYVIKPTGEVVAYSDKRIKQSPDGDFHWCAHRAGIDTGHTICLFVPPRGF